MSKNKNKKDDKGQINYKARLEKKLCLAQETPEPIFDISDCNLKNIPSNVFKLCKVFRKEALYLQKNHLSSLGNHGSLGDLKNITLLDISSNMFTKLPNEISQLESLEVLDASKNQLIELPETIGSLQNLRRLNLSHNNLNHLPDEIGFCKNLEMLDLKNNENLKALPDTLGRIHHLTKLEIDSTIVYPSKEVCDSGINNIMQFLSQNLREDISLPSTSAKVVKQIPSFKDFQEKIELLEKLKVCAEIELEKQNERLRFEKELWEQNEKEVKLQQELKDDKRKLLAHVKNQQESLDAELTKVQEKKNLDRALLIQLCQEEEKKSQEVYKILNSKRNSNIKFATNWEKERKKEEELLFTLTARSKDLERKEILASMGELMRKEILRNQNDRLDAQSLASQVLEQNDAVKGLLDKKNKNNAELLDILRRDEELQKSAVACLLEKSDAMSWKLSQQVAIIEAHLAELTRLEISKRKLESESQITELSKNRIALTEVLVNLFEEQALRRKALVESIRRMETMREANDSSDFWMEQYVKLLNSKSREMVNFLEGVDPKLISELFLNGIIHYTPLLMSIGGSAENLRNLDSATLSKLGVSQNEDRKKFLAAVQSYLLSKDSQQNSPSAPSLVLPSAPLLDSPRAPSSSSASYLVPDECVICLETKPEVIFLPCGHICCCYNCFTTVALCPLCRKPIDSVHKRVDNK